MAEMTIFVKQLRRNVTGRESGSNKQSASKSCALSLVRQLYHLGVIEAFSGTLKKPKTEDSLPPYQVKVNPDIIAKASKALNALKIYPVKINTNINSENPVNLLISDPPKPVIPKPFQDTGSIIAWSPPITNWNPWNASNIDEGYLATATLEQLSDDLLNNSREKIQNDHQLEDRLKDRQKLPIFAMKRQIMETINEHSVVLIRGNTGCGESTINKNREIFFYFNHFLNRKNHSNCTIYSRGLCSKRSRSLVQCHCDSTSKNFSHFRLGKNRSRKV